MIESVSKDEILNDSISKLKGLESALQDIKTTKAQSINIFEAVGMTTQEIKHSAFLAWLLNPKMPHGLKSLFLKMYTARAVLTSVHNVKLKNLIGDYIEMVDTNILKNNKELKKLCDEIRKNHKEAIELLLYYTDNVERINRHCARWLKDNIQGISDVNILPTRTDFCTENIKKFFASHGADWKLDDVRNKFTYRISCKDGPLIGGAFMEKNSDKNATWDSAQIYINEHFGKSKKMGNIYCSIAKPRIYLLEEGFRENGFEEIKNMLEEGLLKFKQQIDDFEKKLLNI